MASNTVSPHHCLQNIVLLVISGLLNNQKLVVADHQLEGPIIVFPGKAVWGITSDTIGPISIGGGDARSSNLVAGHVKGVGSATELSPQNFIRGSVTYNKGSHPWVGKATPLILSPLTQVVGTSFSVVGGDPDLSIFNPPERSSVAPQTTIGFPQITNVTPQTASGFPQTTIDTPPTNTRPSAGNFWFYRRGRRPPVNSQQYPILFPYPHVPIHFAHRGFNKRVWSPNGIHFRGALASLVSQGRSSEPHRLSTLQQVSGTTHSRTSVGKIPFLSSLSDHEDVEEVGRAFYYDIQSSGEETTTRNPVPLSTVHSFLNSLTSISDELPISGEESTTDSSIDEALNFSSKKILSLKERNADNAYVYDDQTAFATQSKVKKFSGSKKSPTASKTTGGDIPDERVVKTSIVVGSAPGSSIVAYYEDDKTSSYSSFQGNSTEDPVDKLHARQMSSAESQSKPSPDSSSSYSFFEGISPDDAKDQLAARLASNSTTESSRYGSSSNSARGPPRYIIVKDESFSHPVTVLEAPSDPASQSPTSVISRTTSTEEHKSESSSIDSIFHEQNLSADATRRENSVLSDDEFNKIVNATVSQHKPFSTDEKNTTENIMNQKGVPEHIAQVFKAMTAEGLQENLSSGTDPVYLVRMPTTVLLQVVLVVWLLCL